VYNAICVFLAGYVVYGYAVYKLRHWDDLGFVCNDIHEPGEKGEWLAWVVWVFAMQKYWEFCDTFFFILRKNFNQVCMYPPPQTPVQRPALTKPLLPFSPFCLHDVTLTSFQVSFLHVYHHASITFVVGYLARYSYSGDVYLAPLLNACVHVCMYSHYLVTALGYRYSLHACIPARMVPSCRGMSRQVRAPDLARSRLDDDDASIA
jgi:elongation of very long chain fatty acids protein 4